MIGKNKMIGIGCTAKEGYKFFETLVGKYTLNFLKKRNDRRFILLTVLFTTLILLSNCRPHPPILPFSQLTTEIQDTLFKLSSAAKQPISTVQGKDTFYTFDETDFVDLRGHCQITHRKCLIGPWARDILITDTLKHRTYSLDYNTPSPILITHNQIIYPVEYNLLMDSITDNTLFTVINW